MDGFLFLSMPKHNRRFSVSTFLFAQPKCLPYFAHPHSDWKWKRPTSEQQGNSGFTQATTKNEYRAQTNRQNSPAKLRIPPTLPTKLLRNTRSNSLAQALPCPELNQPERAMPMTTTYSIDTLTAPKTKQPSTSRTSDTVPLNTVLPSKTERQRRSEANQTAILRAPWTAKGLSKTASLAMAKAIGKLQK